MYKIAVMGDRDSVSGFASLGLEIFPEEDAERAATTLRKMISSGYAVIFMTEKLAAQLEAEIDQYRHMPGAGHHPDPGRDGQHGAGAEKREQER